MMFCDALRLLRVVRPLEEYRYVGFGHWQFVDFELMRRQLGIRSMVSIERDTLNQDRFEENNPFAEIELVFGDSSEVLPDLDMGPPTVAWLDYTARLNAVALSDLRLLAHGLPAGSVVAATFNCHPGKEDQRLDALRLAVGDDVVPGDLSEEDLDWRGLPRVQRRILAEQLAAAAHPRDPSARIQQFMFLRYAETAPMMFWAALIVDETVEELLRQARLSSLEQFRDGDELLEITVPWLSTREVIALNEQIRAGQVPEAKGLERKDCGAYARLHRWYPPVPLPF
jgi:hypothetical protein